MMKQLLVYGSTEGQTCSIWRFLRNEVEAHGYDAEYTDWSLVRNARGQLKKAISKAKVEAEK